jgi:BspA type Leucine rich repeat region (6 copies)
MLNNLGDYNAFLVKYNSAGAVQWAKALASSDQVYATKVKLDPAGNIYLGGSFVTDLTIDATTLTGTGNKDGFLAKFNNAGGLQWVERMSGASNAGAEEAVTDSAGNVYVVGEFGDANGDVVSFGSGITLTNIGSTVPGTPVGDAFLAKYNSSGVIQWAKRAGTTNYDLFTGITTDGRGNFYASGALDGVGMPNGFKAVITKYDTNGVVQWTQTSSGTNGALAFGGPLLDAGTNCYIAGWFQTNVVFGTNVLTGKGYWDFYIAKLGTNALQVIDYTYITNSGTITITGYIGAGGAITIPSTINGLTVTSIGDNSFQSRSSLTSVIIPNSITNIGNGAFFRCSSMSVVSMSSNVINIGYNAFYACPITDIVIPDGVVNIGNAAFQLCTNLTNISIPSSVINIGSAVFSQCASLATITVDTKNPAYYSSADGVLFDKSQTTLIQYPGGKTGSYTIPNGVTNIGQSAFGYSYSLTGVTIPTSVTSIGNGAFYNCDGLTNIAIPTSVTSIGWTAFSGCASLTNITIPNNVTSIGSGAFADCTKLTSITLPTNIESIESTLFLGCTHLAALTIPNGVTNIGFGAFSGCSNLVSIAIPNSVTSMGRGVFWNCASLTSVMMSTNITSIDQQMFYFCTSLTNLTIPIGVTNIGPGAFVGCSSLVSVAIPNSVTTIGYAAFNGCSKLVSIYVSSGVSYIGDYTFLNCSSLSGLFFGGNAPDRGTLYVFSGATNAIVYYLPETTGWDSWSSPPPAVLWNPTAQTSGPDFGIKTNRFGFNITGTTNIPIVVEAATNLTGAAWLPLLNGTLTNGSIYFGDSQWTNYPQRFYRIRSP